MSYDINFWKLSKPSTRKPESIYHALCEGRAVEHLEPLPIEDILTRLKEAFPDFDRHEAFPLIPLEDGAIEVSWSAHHVRFDLRHVPGKVTNQLACLMAEFECPLYDPQVDKRYHADRGMKVGKLPNFATEPTIDAAAFLELMRGVASLEGVNLDDAKLPLEALEALLPARGEPNPAGSAGSEAFDLAPVAPTAFRAVNQCDEATTQAVACGYEVVGDFTTPDQSCVLRAFFLAPNVLACFCEHVLAGRGSILSHSMRTPRRCSGRRLRMARTCSRLGRPARCKSWPASRRLTIRD